MSNREGYIPASYTNPYGIWKVTTEGDEEGRSTIQLGIFKGYVDDIAFALADKSFYKLTFHAVDLSIPTPTNLKESVEVSFDIASGTWNMTKSELVSFAKNVFKERDVTVKENSLFATFTLSREHKIDEIKRQAALAKLTPEERTLLGLE